MLSPKQLAMAWINEKLDPSHINPELEELEALNGAPVPPEKLEEAVTRINEELSKLKVRFAEYVEKYCK